LFGLLWILERPDRGIKANPFKRGQLTGQSIVSQLFFFNNFQDRLAGWISNGCSGRWFLGLNKRFFGLNF
jgi:hypothetical protein